MRSTNLDHHSLNGRNILENFLDVRPDGLGQTLELEVCLAVPILVTALVFSHVVDATGLL